MHDFKQNRYECTLRNESIDPREYMHCQLRDIVPFTDELEDGDWNEMR